jgi:hypothetical protein
MPQSPCTLLAGSRGGTLAEKQYLLAKRTGLAVGVPTMVRYRMDTWEQVQGANGRSPNRQAVAEKEQGTLRITLALGVPPSQLAAGKALGVAAAIGCVLLPVGLLAAVGGVVCRAGGLQH